uniref:Uncharacterized protein n=1 Tax=Trypanosoma congolense (strain IL3000) TaxID=1068625 RepID=G0URG9_TRYCI|nr:conserved hypothetical protein [Trypanosoma congolense IL3000]
MCDASGYIGFAYITPTEFLPCEEIECCASTQAEKCPLLQVTPLDGKCTAVSDTYITEGERRVYVKFLYPLRKVAKAQFFSARSSDRMGLFYHTIRGWLPEVGDFVCYTLRKNGQGGHYPLVESVLSPEMEIPKSFFCQEVRLPLCKRLHCWCAINILVVQPYGDLLSAYIPLLVHRHFMRCKDALVEQISQMCCTSPAEANYMKAQSLFTCALRDDAVELVSSWENCSEEETSTWQVALVYPALATGDLVRIDIVSRTGERFTAQGTVKRCHCRHGVVCYDVEDSFLGTVTEGLTCVQVMPL